MKKITALGLSLAALTAAPTAGATPTTPSDWVYDDAMAFKMCDAAISPPWNGNATELGVFMLVANLGATPQTYSTFSQHVYDNHGRQFAPIRGTMRPPSSTGSPEWNTIRQVTINPGLTVEVTISFQVPPVNIPDVAAQELAVSQYDIWAHGPASGRGSGAILSLHHTGVGGTGAC